MKEYEDMETERKWRERSLRWRRKKPTSSWNPRTSFPLPEKPLQKNILV